MGCTMKIVALKGRCQNISKEGGGRQSFYFRFPEGGGRDPDVTVKDHLLLCLNRGVENILSALGYEKLQ